MPRDGLGGLRSWDFGICMRHVRKRSGGESPQIMARLMEFKATREIVTRVRRGSQCWLRSRNWWTNGGSGYCFGGMTVLELARSGTELQEW